MKLKYKITINSKINFTQDRSPGYKTHIIKANLLNNKQIFNRLIRKLIKIINKQIIYHFILNNLQISIVK